MSTDKAKTAEVPAVAPSARVAIFDWLQRKYVQRQDERQRAMGLVYMEAETHDLAEEIAARLESEHADHLAAMEALRQEVATSREAEEALRAEVAARGARIAEMEHAFKNFHSNLCKRFGYSHDEVDWKRDQVSLEEHIAARCLPDGSAPITQAKLAELIQEGFMAGAKRGIEVAVSDMSARGVQFKNPAPDAAVPAIGSPCVTLRIGAESVGGSLVHPDDAAKAGAAIGPNFNPMR